MKPKYGDFVLHLSPRRQQILDDPHCPDVTYDELKILIMRLKQNHRYEDVAVLTKRYDYLLSRQHQRTRKFNDIICYMVENGEKIKNIEQVSHSTRPFLTDVEKALLTGTYNNPNFSVIKHVEAHLIERNMKKEVEQLHRLYKDIFIKGNKKLIEEYHKTTLPDNYPITIDYIMVNEEKIDGEIPFVWKLLNDPNYIPKLSNLRHQLKLLLDHGRESDAMKIMDKYEKMLYQGLPEPDTSLEDAHSIINSILQQDCPSFFCDDAFYIDSNTIVNSDGVIHYVDANGEIIDESEYQIMESDEIEYPEDSEW